MMIRQCLASWPESSDADLLTSTCGHWSSFLLVVDEHWRRASGGKSTKVLPGIYLLHGTCVAGVFNFASIPGTHWNRRFLSRRHNPDQRRVQTWPRAQAIAPALHPLLLPCSCCSGGGGLCAMHRGHIQPRISLGHETRAMSLVRCRYLVPSESHPTHCPCVCSLCACCRSC
jgi:hypothetical protein